MPRSNGPRTPQSDQRPQQPGAKRVSDLNVSVADAGVVFQGNMTLII